MVETHRIGPCCSLFHSCQRNTKWYKNKKDALVTRLKSCQTGAEWWLCSHTCASAPLVLLSISPSSIRGNFKNVKKRKFVVSLTKRCVLCALFTFFQSYPRAILASLTRRSTNNIYNNLDTVSTIKWQAKETTA